MILLSFVLAQRPLWNLWRKWLKICLRGYLQCITPCYENRTVFSNVTGGERTWLLHELMSWLQGLIFEVIASHKYHVNILKGYGFINARIWKIVIANKQLRQVSIAEFTIIVQNVHFEPEYTPWHVDKNVSLVDGSVVVVITSATHITRPLSPKNI